MLKALRPTTRSAHNYHFYSGLYRTSVIAIRQEKEYMHKDWKGRKFLDVWLFIEKNESSDKISEDLKLLLYIKI